MPAENLTRTEAQGRADLLSVDSYVIDLDFSRPTEDTFGSTTTVRFSATEGGSTFIDAITDSVTRVVLNGRELDPAAVADGTRIQLDNLGADNELTVEARMKYMNTGEGLHRFTDPADGDVYLYTQFEVPDSRRVFAVFEQPDLKATFQFTVRVPENWTVVSNQPTGEPEKNDGVASFAFEPTVRLASYVTAIVAGPYKSVHSELTSADGRIIPLGLYARASLMEHVDAEEIFELTRQGFEFFEREFDRPYPFAKYDQLFVPEFNAGAMENAGAVTILEDYVFRSRVAQAKVERRAITVLHELAHMWFGDLVTMKWWNDLWLNESFAEYASHLAAVEATKYKDAWTTFAAVEKSWAYAQDQLPSTHPIVAPINDLEDVQVNFDGITYAKGASVLKQLVAWVGQEEFMQGVRSYFAKHAFGNTTLPDLLSEFEASSGRDLKEWSKAWLETSQVNTLRPEVAVDEDGVITELAIAQSAVAEHPVLRPHRLAVGFYNLNESGALERTDRIELDVDGERTVVTEAAGKKRPALLLLNDEDLAYAKIRLDDASFRTATRSLGAVSDSLARNLLWSAAWDGTRDGEIPARNFIELAIRNLGTETDSSATLIILRQLATSVDLYVDPADRDAIRVALAESLWDLTEAAEAGSDNQLQFVKAFAEHARSSEHLDILESLLTGGKSLPGLPMDQDLKWDLLTALVVGGRAGETEIAAMAAQDKTSTGEKSAARARAAVQGEEAKKEAWKSVVKGAELSNNIQSGVIEGFNKVTDPAQLSEFAAKYFKNIERIWDERTNDEAQRIVTGLYPRLQADQATVDASEAFLGELGDRKPALRRLVSESTDLLRRALKAQAADK